MLFKSKLTYYTDIDEMPIFNWFKIQETNNLSWMLINNREITVPEKKQLEIAIGKLNDQYIDAFGISDKYRRILEIKRDLRVLEIEYFKTKNRYHLTFIEVKRHELKAMFAKENKADMGSVRVHVAKYIGNCDFKKISVKFFYEILIEIKKEYTVKKQAAA